MKKTRKLVAALGLALMLASCQNGGLSSGLASSSVSTTETTSSSLSSSSSSSSSSSVSTSSVDWSVDPYEDIDTPEEREAFYESYAPASCAMDSYYRSLHFLMSGSIEEQDQEPTLAADQPMEGTLYVRNETCRYSDDGSTYTVLDSQGNVAMEIYKGGAYATLDEVAAYVFAFHDIPANYVSGKTMRPSQSPWGEYLRLNHSSFSGNISKYPYQPALPGIVEGDYLYYEIDIGTTGTDCDPNQAIAEYNDGQKITRGAARIVYTRYLRGKEAIEDPNDGYVFYTYNHYNDFQEYLNYAGGWGEIFGNITGGGKLSSKVDCNPTPYVETAREYF